MTKLLPWGLPLALLVLSCQARPADLSAPAIAGDSVAPSAATAAQVEHCPPDTNHGRLYLADRPAGTAQAPTLLPIDPLTLADLPGCPAIETGSPVWKLSADGSTLVAYESTRLWNSWMEPDQITFVVRDAPTGAERARFHPPQLAYLWGVAQDGSRVLLSGLRRSDTAREPWLLRHERWLVVDGQGRLVATVEDDQPLGVGAPLQQLDAKGRRLVQLKVPQSDTESGPWPSTLVVHDLQGGQAPLRLDLPAVLAGGWQSDRGLRIPNCSDCPILTSLTPGAAIARDGTKVAIAHADREALTVVDLDQMAVMRTVALERAKDLFDLIGLRPSTAHAKVLDGAERRSALGSEDRVYVWGTDWTAREDGQEETQSYRLRAVDSRTGRVLGEGLANAAIDWVEDGLDGVSVYTFGPASPSGAVYMGSSPYVLRRLDAATLRVLAEREVKGFREHAFARDHGSQDYR